MKAGKTALSFFLLGCLFLPLNEIGRGFTLQWERIEDASQYWEDELQQDAEQLSYSLAEDHILKLIQTRLESLGLEVFKLDAEFIESEEGITLRVLMDLSKKESIQESELRTILFQEYGLQEVEINWQEVK